MLKIIKKAISGSNNTNSSSSQSNSADNSPVQNIGYQNNALDNSGFLESQYSTPNQYASNGTGYNMNTYNANYNSNTTRKSSKTQNDSGSYNLTDSRSMSIAHRTNVYNGSPVSCLPQGNMNFSATSQSSPGNMHLPQNIPMSKHSNQFYPPNQNLIAIKKSTTNPEFEHLEQQLKSSQQKYQDLENQFKSQNEQIKDLKGTIQSLNDMNHKFYDEIQHLKDRNLEQRKQIESFNKLFQDCKQDSDRKLSHIRQELDQSLKREMEFKKMVQQVQESKNHEISSLKDKLDRAKSTESHNNTEMEKKISEIKAKSEKIEQLEKSLSDIQLEFSLYKETSVSEQKKIETIAENLRKEVDNLKRQIEDERKSYQEKSKMEKSEQKKHLDELEQKLEEVIKEKAEITCKYAQLIDRNKELDELIKTNNENNEKSLKVSRSELETFKNKCANLERELSECHDHHSKEKEEWKKFQADLQTAVRVANDFMNEAEEKYNKIKEELLFLRQKDDSINKEDSMIKFKENRSPTDGNFSDKSNKEGNSVSKTENGTADINSLNGTNSEQYEISNYFHTNTDTDDAKLLSYNNMNNGHYLFKKNNGSSNSTEYSPSVTNSNFDSLSSLVKQYGVSRRNALMKWCQERLYSYNIEIKNFSSSWSDGLAFCALLHSFVPDKINYEAMIKDKSARNRLSTAFNLVESLGIEQKLNINDIVNQDRPDWNEIMNYVALIYSHFNNRIKEEFNNTEKKSLGKKLEITKDKPFSQMSVTLSSLPSNLTNSK